MVIKWLIMYSPIPLLVVGIVEFVVIVVFVMFDAFCVVVVIVVVVVIIRSGVGSLKTGPPLHLSKE